MKLCLNCGRRIPRKLDYCSEACLREFMEKSPVGPKAKRGRKNIPYYFYY